jgi:hypothetical protein
LSRACTQTVREQSSSFFEKKAPKKLLLRFARVCHRCSPARPDDGAAQPRHLNRAAPILESFFLLLFCSQKRRLFLASEAPS